MKVKIFGSYFEVSYICYKFHVYLVSSYKIRVYNCIYTILLISLVFRLWLRGLESISIRHVKNTWRMNWTILVGYLCNKLVSLIRIDFCNIQRKTFNQALNYQRLFLPTILIFFGLIISLLLFYYLIDDLTVSILNYLIHVLI